MKNYFFLIFCFFGLTALAQPYELGHTTITFNDPTRTGGFGSGGGTGRQIQTEIYYPADVAGDDVAVAESTFPVIVFGHGFAMTWSAYENIWTALVDEGYIIAFPRTEGGLFPTPSHEDFGLDLALVEQKLQNEATVSNSLFFERISASSAIVGHSMGGGASFIAASNNTNIKTVIGLAPAETDPSAITAAANVTVPALVFTADEDAVTPQNDHHIPIYNAVNAPCKYLINIIGGAHCYYANSNTNCDFGESTSGGNITITRQDQQDIMFRYLIPWLNMYLKDLCEDKDVFETDLLTDSEVTFQSTCSSFPSVAYNLNVDLNDVTLTSQQNGTSYQWIDCDDNNSPINGATNQSFQVIESGNYAVILGTGTCADTSECTFVNTVDIQENNQIKNDVELIQVVDLLGRESKIKLNETLIYIYSDGTRKKIFKTEK